MACEGCGRKVRNVIKAYCHSCFEVNYIVCITRATFNKLMENKNIPLECVKCGKEIGKCHPEEITEIGENRKAATREWVVSHPAGFDPYG
ncbi:MAG: hypothetical protein KAQ87_04750 [Candidatus Pacebacteria bacterium]|nr:hypothetical protein [Candidatus Paceibacterota bacterium]